MTRYAQLRDAIYRVDVVEARHLAGDDPVALDYLEGHEISLPFVHQRNPKSRVWTPDTKFGNGWATHLDVGTCEMGFGYGDGYLNYPFEGNGQSRADGEDGGDALRLNYDVARHLQRKNHIRKPGKRNPQSTDVD